MGRHKALFFTWAVMGFWHGANWTFLLWGLYHAALIFIYRILPFNFDNLPKLHLRTLASLTFLPAIMLGWIPFRAQNLSDSIFMMSRVFDYTAYNWLGLRENYYLIALALLLGQCFCYFVYRWINNKKIDQSNTILTFECILLSLLAPIIFVFFRPIAQFIYFQF